MAGRGTDIKLGEGVAEMGGLHVICTEMHDASRSIANYSAAADAKAIPAPTAISALDDDLLLTGWSQKGQKLKKSANNRPAYSIHWGNSSASRKRKSNAATSANAKALMYFEKERKKNATTNGPRPLSRYAGLVKKRHFASATALQKQKVGWDKRKCRPTTCFSRLLVDCASFVPPYST